MKAHEGGRWLMWEGGVVRGILDSDSSSSNECCRRCDSVGLVRGYEDTECHRWLDGDGVTDDGLLEEWMTGMLL